MQPSRMFNSNEMQRAALLREVAGMRLAEKAAPKVGVPAAGLNPVAALGSLAFRIARWRRLAAREAFEGHVFAAATSSGPSGRLTVAE